jgi:HEAT repeat protein
VKSEYEPTPEPRKPAVPEHLTLSPLMAQALDAPDASVRRQVLDLWAQQGTEAPLDPLVVALEDEDDDVRTRAMEIIEQHWSIEQHAEIETQH